MKKKNPSFRAVFPADVTAKILARGQLVGPGGRLFVRDDGEKTFVSILPPEGVASTLDDEPCEFNNAHRCPPNTDCPGGG